MIRLSSCAWLALTALLAGCAGVSQTLPSERPPEARPPAPVNLSGYNATFKAGYSDGCASAGSNSRRRNEARYKSETDYMMGWNDGYSVCAKRR